MNMLRRCRRCVTSVRASFVLQCLIADNFKTHTITHTHTDRYRHTDTQTRVAYKRNGVAKFSSKSTNLQVDVSKTSASLYRHFRIYARVRVLAGKRRARLR